MNLPKINSLLWYELELNFITKDFQLDKMTEHPLCVCVCVLAYVFVHTCADGFEYLSFSFFLGQWQGGGFLLKVNLLVGVFTPY